MSAQGGRLIIAGLGPGSWDALPLGVLERLRRGGVIFLRTERHPVVPRLRAEGINFTVLDKFFREEAAAYQRVAAILLKEAATMGEVLYAVPGHPLVDEGGVAVIRERAKEAGAELQILPAPSLLDAVTTFLGLDSERGLVWLRRPDDRCFSPSLPVLIWPLERTQLTDWLSFLLSYYPPQHPVTWVNAWENSGAARQGKTPLVRLGQVLGEGPLAVSLPPLDQLSPRYSLAPLVAVMAELRGEKGCPWDREQTHQSLKQYLLEEVYEVLEAIDRVEEAPHNLCEELGDLLLQIIFHCQIAAEAGRFDVDEVVRNITDKMIRRHPHVFGGEWVADSQGVIRSWERIKRQEKGGRTSLMDGLGRNWPALLRAAKVQRRAARVGFDWPDWRGAAAKVREELEEVERAQSGKPEELLLELGDLLFAVVNLARLLGVEAEEALNRSVDKFIARFRYLEAKAYRDGVSLEEAGLEWLDAGWEEAKKKLKKTPEEPISQQEKRSVERIKE
ncbi:nucleoside triphosphate pyrophosphohydrolase [Desulfothermobacter acidiphilus]|uniref:nucleoside triphosphate pyrophosphohydrolase n=1 Tax=Desulfothermobacter acidiphilus TaxID=1938353 RepID=UPI003F894770